GRRSATSARPRCPWHDGAPRRRPRPLRSRTSPGASAPLLAGSGSRRADSSRGRRSTSGPVGLAPTTGGPRRRPCDRGRPRPRAQTRSSALAAEGAPDRTVVVADHQSSGRGRRGRTWTDAPGMSLLASILIRPRVAPTLLATFSIATAVAVAEALRRATGIEAGLKWPNDV